MKGINNIFDVKDIPIYKAVTLYRIRNYEIQQRIYHLYKALKRMDGFKGLYLLGSSTNEKDVYFSDVDLAVYTDSKHYMNFANYLEEYYDKVEHPKDSLIHKGEFATFDIHATTDPKIKAKGIKVENVYPPRLLIVDKRPIEKERLANAILTFKHYASLLKKEATTKDYLYIYQISMSLYCEYYKILKLLYKNSGYAIPYFEEDAIKLASKFTSKDFAKVGKTLLLASKDYTMADDIAKQTTKAIKIAKRIVKELDAKKINVVPYLAGKVLKTL